MSRPSTQAGLRARIRARHHIASGALMRERMKSPGSARVGIAASWIASTSPSGAEGAAV